MAVTGAREGQVKTVQSVVRKQGRAASPGRLKRLRRLKRESGHRGVPFEWTSEMGSMLKAGTLVRRSRSRGVAGAGDCTRIYRRQDGTILTQDCPVGLAAIRRRFARIAGAAFSAMLSVTSSALASSLVGRSSRTPSFKSAENRKGTARSPVRCPIRWAL